MPTFTTAKITVVKFNIFHEKKYGKSENLHVYKLYFNFYLLLTAGQKIKKTRQIKEIQKIFFREIASLVVLNFSPLQKLSFGHF